jgi:hypothetical protein
MALPAFIYIAGRYVATEVVAAAALVAIDYINKPKRKTRKRKR